MINRALRDTLQEGPVNRGNTQAVPVQMMRKTKETPSVEEGLSFKEDCLKSSSQRLPHH